MALGNSPRYGQRIILIGIHTAEGARNKESLYSFFDRERNGSSHVGIDGFGISPEWVPDELAAWTLLNGNARSLNAELCGFAAWTREQWLSTGVVDGVTNPRQMIRNAARWAKDKCIEHGIPMVKLSPADVDAGKWGIIGHADWTYSAIGDGDHTDPGRNFPWDVFMSDMGATSGGGGETEGGFLSNLSEYQQNVVFEAAKMTTSGVEGLKPPGEQWLAENAWRVSVDERMNRIEQLLYRILGEEPPAQPPASERKTHTVVKGDTLWKLAQTYGVSVQDLQSYNNMGPATALAVGQVLFVTAS